MNSFYSVFLFAQKILAQRIHSQKELLRKLQKKFPEQKKICLEVLKKCEEYGWINDREFAKNFLHHRLSGNRIRGAFFIAHELRQRGISEKIVTEMRAMAEKKEAENALFLVEQKMRSFSSENEHKNTEKVLRFLCSRGFSCKVGLTAIEQWKSHKQEKA